tara:strand:+ start:1981 stop:2202 length:222 start_codon:yes stop_codon:yes gene_type:complete
MPNKKTKNSKTNRTKLKTKKRDINTTFADRIYNKSKIDETLIAKGYHTEGKLRGKVNTSVKRGGNNQMIDMSV